MTCRPGWLVGLLALLGTVGASAPAAPEAWPSESFKLAFLGTTAGDFAFAIVVAVAVGGLSLLNGPRRRK